MIQPVISPAQTTESWDSGVKCVGKCELIEDLQFSILISTKVHARVTALSKRLEHTEWAGFLLGERKDATFHINHIIVPDQVVSRAHFTVTKPITGGNVLGTLHSHHTMGAFHSGEDLESCGSNYQIVVTFGLPSAYAGKVRHTLPCGSIMFIDAPVAVSIPPIDTEDFVKAALTHITQQTFTQFAYGYDDIYGDDWLSGYNLAPESKTPAPPRATAHILYCGLCREPMTWQASMWSSKHDKLLCPKCFADPLSKARIEAP